MNAIAKNGAFYFTERCMNIFFALASGILMARGFGPENIGKFTYFQSISSFLVMISSLGFDHFIVRDLVEKRNEEGEVIGTAITLQLVGWAVYSSVYFSCLLLLGAINNHTIFIYFAIIFSALFNRVSILRFYFEARQKGKIISVSTFASKLISLIFIAIIYWVDGSFYTVVNYILVESFVLALALFLLYQRIGFGVLSWRFSLKGSKELLLESWPFIISGFVFPVYMSADIIMIKYFIGEYEVGIYSVAMKLMLQLNFIGVIITTLYFPKIITLYKSNLNEVKGFVELILITMLTISIVAIFSVNFTSQYVITHLYGEDFKKSSDIINILCFIWLFFWPGTMFSRLIILERVAKIELFKTLCAALLNIIMNYILIPSYGIHGAAIASLLSYFVSDLFFYLLFKKTRWFFCVWLISFFKVFNIKKNLNLLKETFF